MIAQKRNKRSIIKNFNKLVFIQPVKYLRARARTRGHRAKRVDDGAVAHNGERNAEKWDFYNALTKLNYLTPAKSNESPPGKDFKISLS